MGLRDSLEILRAIHVACNRTVRTRNRTAPLPDRVRTYATMYRHYRDLHPALRDVMRAVSTAAEEGA